MIFETHAHYEDERFEQDRDEILSSLSHSYIEALINVGSTLKTSQESVLLSEKYERVFAAVGIHPSEVKDHCKSDLEEIAKLAQEPKTVSIGEIGLDYYWDKEEDVRETQKDWFEEQMKLALSMKLPVIIHSRDAARDTYQIIEKYAKQGVRGVVHCYSGSVEMAADYRKLGFLIGVGGVVTFKNAKLLKEVVKSLTLEDILLETDCPYMAPEPHRGERNSSLYLPDIAAKIGELKGVETEEVIEATKENAYQLFYKVTREEGHGNIRNTSGNN